MRIQGEALKHWIDHFYGYGSWQARMWFIAHEEGGGDLPEEVAERVDYFYDAYPDDKHAILCDLRELYRHVTLHAEGVRKESFPNLFEFRFGSRAVTHNVWRSLIAFFHGYQNTELPDALEYQKNKFASPLVGNEALIRLYPLPSPHNHGWYYSWLDMPQFPFLRSRALYEKNVYQNRIENILVNMRAYKPEVVLMYGMNNINMLKESVQAFFPSAKFKMIKAVKRKIPQHHLGQIGDTTIIITTQIPALRHNRIETGFDWMEFGKAVNSKAAG